MLAPTPFIHPRSQLGHITRQLVHTLNSALFNKTHPYSIFHFIFFNSIWTTLLELLVSFQDYFYCIKGKKFLAAEIKPIPRFRGEAFIFFSDNKHWGEGPGSPTLHQAGYWLGGTE